MSKKYFVETKYRKSRTTQHAGSMEILRRTYFDRSLSKNLGCIIHELAYQLMAVEKITEKIII